MRKACWACWLVQKVLIPAVEEYFADTTFRARLLLKPCQALPGSEEKVRILQERAALKLPLFHKEDATLGLRDGFLPLAWGGDWLAGGLAYENCDGTVEEKEKRTIVKRQRSEGEKVRRQSQEMKEMERLRGQRRRQSQQVGCKVYSAKRQRDWLPPEVDQV